MKRFVLVCVLALPVLALSQQEAKAWVKFGIGASFNVNFESGGKHLCWSSENPPCTSCPAPGCYGYGYGYGYGFDGYGYAATPAAPQAAAYAQPQVIPAAYSGYYYSPSASCGYYPAYWYGR